MSALKGVSNVWTLGASLVCGAAIRTAMASMICPCRSPLRRAPSSWRQPPTSLARPHQGPGGLAGEYRRACLLLVPDAAARPLPGGDPAGTAGRLAPGGKGRAATAALILRYHLADILAVSAGAEFGSLINSGSIILGKTWRDEGTLRPIEEWDGNWRTPGGRRDQQVQELAIRAALPPTLPFDREVTPPG